MSRLINTGPRLLAFLFVLSGLTSLVYEIVWTRILSTIIGNTSLAVALVVCIFMAGLAIGSFFSARWSQHNRNPFYSYATLELLIGAYSLATPYLAPWVENIYSAGYSAVASNFFLSVLLKSVLTTLFLLLPTIAMGATLPILIRAFTQQERLHKAALLYASNTAGAVGGTLLAGYVLLPQFGISKTIELTACVNALIGVIAFLMGAGKKADEERTPALAAFHPLYLLPFFAGFAALSYEVLWTRALSMFFGSSVYAFSTILAAFLLGIASGSMYYARRIPDNVDPFEFFSLIQFRLALAAVFFLGIFMGIPYVLIKMFQTFYGSFALFQTAQFLLIGCTVFYATFLSGASFPAALYFFRGSPQQMECHAGYIYSHNTMGSILGSLCAGFLLLPTVGVEMSIRLVVLVNLALGFVCFRKSSAAGRDKKILAIGIAALVLLVLLPRWNRSIYNAGFYAFAYRYVPSTKKAELSPASQSLPFLQAQLIPSARAARELKLIYYGEGLAATVAVVEDEQKRIRSLLINGKPDASNVPSGDMRTQLLLGHLPVLLKGDARNALVIGLGSGVTAGALWTHHLARIDCVEIERKVAGALSYFEKENLGVYKKQNFRIIFDDGRNVVQHSPLRYDIITSEPSNLWMSGVANLFTLEFFQAARQRLESGGVMCQWIHLYQISSHDVLIFLKTFHSVFPFLSLWIDGGDMLVLGSDRPLRVDYETLRKQWELPDVLRSLARSDLTPENILRRYVSDERIVLILKASLPLNRDDHPILEFSAPKSLFWDHSSEIIRNIYELRRIADLNAVVSETKLRDRKR